MDFLDFLKKNFCGFLGPRVGGNSYNLKKNYTMCARITESVFVTSCICFGLIRVCCVPCARVCGPATHGLPAVWVSTPGPTSVPSNAQAGWYRGKRQLCAVLVLRRRGTRIRRSGTEEFGICVLTVMADMKNIGKIAGLHTLQSHSKCCRLWLTLLVKAYL